MVAETRKTPAAAWRAALEEQDQVNPKDWK
jgi:hypothetical protein